MEKEDAILCYLVMQNYKGIKFGVCRASKQKN